MKNITYWQQAAGDKDRNYVAQCINNDVILNGPGEYGHFNDYYEQYTLNDVSSRKITDLNRFCNEIKEGDIIVLRLGTNEVLGVGVVIGEYEWIDYFGDVDGWDLQHTRRVKWLWSGNKKFSTYTLKQGDTTQKLTSKEVIEWIECLDLKSSENREIKILPLNQKYHIPFSVIEESLFSFGVSDISIRNLSNEFNSLVRIASWYTKYDNPSEFETVSHLTVPLLKNLGWTPQKMAIEWRNVDIALFENLPRKDENLSVVIEAKKKDSSCLSAFSQAEGYAKDKNNCQRLIVTDGLRYGVYLKDKTTNEFVLYAYVNLLRLQNSYPIYNCHGACEAFKAMTPEWDDYHQVEY